MAGNTFGTFFKLTSFGESHGPAIGGVIDGCPSGLMIDIDFIFAELRRRKTGIQDFASSRKEDDAVEFLSGIYNGRTTGTPIGFIIRNKDHRPEDYDQLKEIFRPSHGDFTYEKKYKNRDHRGGGRSSARETAVRVVGGAIAKLFLKEAGIQFMAYVSAIGPVSLEKTYGQIDFEKIEQSIVRCPDEDTTKKIEEYLDEIVKAGDTSGGQVTCVITGTPAGLGEPVFDKLQADLAKAMMSINATKGFEYGSGFESMRMRGSDHNDPFFSDQEHFGKIRTKTNWSGGIQAGISNGEDIYFNVAFKPVSTIMMDQRSVDSAGKEVLIKPGGRHDVCIVPRAVPIVEAMAALVMIDHLLRDKANK